MNIARSIIVIFQKLIFRSGFRIFFLLGEIFYNIKVIRAVFQEVSFTDCKILGISFCQINAIGLSLTFLNSTLNLSSFYKLDLRNSKLTKSTFLETDFTEAKLTDSVFDACDLGVTIFENTNLS